MKSGGTLGRALPLLALVVALLGAWLAPPAAALAGGTVPALDTVDCGDRAAVKPKAPAQLQTASKKRHLEAPSGASPAAIATSADHVGYAYCHARLAFCSFETFLPTPAALVAQPRAPPSSRT